MRNPPSTIARLRVAALVGAISGFYFLGSISDFRPGDDFTWYWLGARAIIAGKDPYSVIQPGGPFHLDAPFIYPLTTAITAIPFAWLPLAWAATLFVAIGAALLSWAITRESFNRLPMLGSAPFLWAVNSGQLSPWIAAAALLPRLGWIAAAKPNIGMATLMYRPSRVAIGGVVLFGVASLALNPSWPLEWISTLQNGAQLNSGKGIPLLLAGGPILLLALLRWRTPAARLLLVMAIVPQSIMFYDQLLLWLIPRTRLQNVAMSTLSLAGLVLGVFALPDHPTHNDVARTFWPMLFATCYLPALVLVLSQENTTTSD